MTGLLLGMLLASATVPLEPEVRATTREVGEVFLDANKAFDQGRYADAVADFQALIERDAASAEVYYDLGNAWLRGGNLGHAIAAYREAQARAPRDADIQANLEFARSSTLDATRPPQPAPLMLTLFFWHYALSLRERWLTLVALNFAFFGVLSMRRGRRESEWLRWASWLFGLPLLAVAGSLTVAALAPQRVAVVTAETVQVRAGDSDDAVVRFEVHEGAELAQIERRGDWLRVAMDDGEGGWLRARAVLTTP